MGIHALRQAVYTGGFEEKGWTEYGFLGISGPKTGLVSLLDHKPLGDKTLEVVPKDALGFHAFQLDLGALLTQLRDGIGKVDRTMQRSFDLWMVQARGMLMFDVQKDFMAPLGAQWVLYEAAPSGDDAGGMALVNPLRDAAVLKRTMHTLESLLTEAGAQIDHARRDEVDFSMLKLPTTSIGWALAEGNLIVAQPGALIEAAKQVKHAEAFDSGERGFSERCGSGWGRRRGMRRPWITRTCPSCIRKLRIRRWGMWQLASLPRLISGFGGLGIGAGGDGECSGKFATERDTGCGQGAAVFEIGWRCFVDG